MTNQGAVVGPDIPQVIPLEPAFITPQDGHKKQDCEAVPAARWIHRVGSRLSPLGVTLWGDARYAVQNMIWVSVEKELTRTQGTGKKHCYLFDRYINRVPLVDAADPLELNWVGFSIANDKGEITYCPVSDYTFYALATGYPCTTISHTKPAIRCVL